VHEYERWPVAIDPDSDRPTVVRLDVQALGHVCNSRPFVCGFAGRSCHGSST
jgi:hypothetical protein